MAQNPFCANHSAAVGEQLAGTAPRVDTWFLLEYTGRWESNALEESALPTPVKQHLIMQRDLLPNARFAFIRRQPRHTVNATAWKLGFYVALIRETQPVLYAFSLERYDDLLTWDISAICAEATAYDQFKRRDPLLVVCTHGRRDPCCARAGLPVYERISDRVDVEVWQTSHVGGHRFAANIVQLPHGIYYGRVQPETAPAIIDAARTRQFYLEAYRGRACYDKPVQAAEYFLRQDTGITALDAFQLASADQTGDGEWEIRFIARQDGSVHTLRLAAEQIAEYSYMNCDDETLSAVTHYHRLP